MKPYVANLLNAIILIGLGTWGFLDSAVSVVNEAGETLLTYPQKTPLIPVAFGVILLICTPFVKKENKAVAHIAVLLTLLIIIGLIKPLTSQIEQGDSLGIARIVIMQVSSVIAMIFFIKSFRDARKARQ